MYFTVKVKRPRLIIEYLDFGENFSEVFNRAAQRFNTTQIRILRSETK